MNWRSHILVWGSVYYWEPNTDRFNKLLASQDLRTKMLYEIKRQQRGMITLPMKRGMTNGKRRVTMGRVTTKTRQDAGGGAAASGK